MNTAQKLENARKNYIEVGKMCIPYGSNRHGVNGWHLPFGDFTTDRTYAVLRMERIYAAYGIPSH